MLFICMHDGLCLLKVVLKLALGQSHVVKEVPSRENAYSPHWFVFFLCARFRPALIGLHSINFHCLEKM